MNNPCCLAESTVDNVAVDEKRYSKRHNRNEPEDSRRVVTIDQRSESKNNDIVPFFQNDKAFQETTTKRRHRN